MSQLSSEDYDGAWICLINPESGYAVDLQGGNGDNGSHITGYAFNPNQGYNSHQIFRISNVPGSDDTWYIMNKGSATYVDLAHGDAADNTLICNWERDGGRNQMWRFTIYGQGTKDQYVEISNAMSGTWMYLPPGGEGTQLVGHSLIKTKWQIFVVPKPWE